MKKGKVKNQNQNQEEVVMIENQIVSQEEIMNLIDDRDDYHKTINLQENQKIVDYLKKDHENIHKFYKDSQEISFDQSIEILKVDKSRIEDYSLLMITVKSREIYYLFLIDNKKNESQFIMKNDSIMKNKIYSLKFIQNFNQDSIKIIYNKIDREKDSHEIIKKSSSDYNKKKEKYSSI